MILSESVPIWLAAGVITVGGWLFEQTSDHSTRVADHGSRISVVENAVISTSKDIREVRDQLNKIELMLIGKQ